MGIVKEVNLKYDAHRRILKNQVTNVETFLCNNIKKHCVNIEYGTNGTTFAFSSKTLAENAAEKILKMITNQHK